MKEPKKWLQEVPLKIEGKLARTPLWASKGGGELDWGKELRIALQLDFELMVWGAKIVPGLPWPEAQVLAALFTGRAADHCRLLAEFLQKEEREQFDELVEGKPSLFWGTFISLRDPCEILSVFFLLLPPFFYRHDQHLLLSLEKRPKQALQSLVKTEILPSREDALRAGQALMEKHLPGSQCALLQEKLFSFTEELGRNWEKWCQQVLCCGEAE